MLAATVLYGTYNTATDREYNRDIDRTGQLIAQLAHQVAPEQYLSKVAVFYTHLSFTMWFCKQCVLYHRLYDLLRLYPTSRWLLASHWHSDIPGGCRFTWTRLCCNLLDFMAIHCVTLCAFHNSCHCPPLSSAPFCLFFQCFFSRCNNNKATCKWQRNGDDDDNGDDNKIITIDNKQ